MMTQQLVKMYPARSRTSWLRQPHNLADIRQRRANGESFATIAEAFDVSRERVRQVCSIEQIPGPNWDSLYASGIERIKKGDPITQVMADNPHWNHSQLRKACVAAGLKMDKTGAAARRWLGAKFGMWKVIGEFHGRESKHSKILCRCDCGTERMVAMHALKTGGSMGCGCRNSNGGRQVIPWLCVETGKTFPNTYRAALDAGVTPTCLHIANRKGKESYVSSKNGKTYIPLRDLAISHEAFMTNLKRTGETVYNLT